MLEDLARASGVSVSTVSRALRDKPGVSSAVRAKIARVAEELHYVPNHSARSLVLGRTDTIGLVMPPMLEMTPHHEAVQRLELLATDDGKRIMHVSYAREECKSLLALAREHHWDGLLLFPYTTTMAQEELGKVIARMQIPVIVLGGPLSKWADSITYDRTHGVRLLIEHLAAMGRRKLVLACGDVEWRKACHNSKYLRLREELQARGMAFSGVIPFGVPSAHGRGLYEATLSGFREGWRGQYDADCIMASNDLAAAAVMNVLRADGVRIPEDIAVTGYDDTEWSYYLRPALTTIRRPLEDMMELAWSMLKQRMDGDSRAPRHVTLQPTLMARASTGACTGGPAVGYEDFEEEAVRTR